MRLMLFIFCHVSHDFLLSNRWGTEKRVGKKWRWQEDMGKTWRQTESTKPPTLTMHVHILDLRKVMFYFLPW